MDDVVRLFQHSASLAKTWGTRFLPSGKTLAETLTIQGLPLWEVIAPELVLYRVQKVIKSRQWATFRQRIRPYLSWVRYSILNLATIKRNCQGCIGWPPEPVFLFLGFNSYMYRDVLQPVVATLAAGKEIFPVILHDGWSPQTTAKLSLGVECQSIWQHWGDGVATLTRLLQQELKAAVTELETTGGLPEIFQDQERKYWPHMKATFTWLLRVCLPRLLPQAAIARHILEKHCPALIVSPDVADPRNRLYYYWGRLMGIPSLEIQFGIYGPSAVEWQFFAADRLSAWGAESKDIFLFHGVPENKIMLTGSPRYDALANIDQEMVDSIRAQLGVPGERAMVLFASTYFLPANDHIVSSATIASIKRSVFQAAHQVAGVRLVVKPHPLEDVRETKHLAKGYDNIIFVDKDADIRKLIAACDAFVTFGSTVTMEALIANKLTICPTFPGWNWSNPFGESGATLVPHSADDVIHCFQKVVDGSRDRLLAELEPARKRFLTQWVYKADGLSSSRIASLAMEMAQTDSKSRRPDSGLNKLCIPQVQQLKSKRLNQ